MTMSPPFQTKGALMLLSTRPNPTEVLFAALLGLCASHCGGDASGGDTSSNADTSPPQDTGEGDATATDTNVPDPGTDETIAPPCNSFECVDGVASECNGDFSLSCGLFQASCTQFEADDGLNGWCDCGNLGEGEVLCTAATEGVICDGGLGVPFGCIPGTTCREVDGVPDCYCDDADDGVCPGDQCGDDPDCASCTPSCGGRDCGDNGCGGSCGSCDLGDACVAGTCTCAPSCDGKSCGGDGCGGSCGSCADGLTCSNGQCLAGLPEAIDLGLTLRVYRFTLSPSHIYFIGLGADARPHAFRCPIDGCSGAPERISAAGDAIDPLYTDIELAGDEVFWIEGDQEIWRADIAGATPGPATQAWTEFGSPRIYSGLRGDDGNIYAIASELKVGSVPKLIEIPGDGGDAVAYPNRLSALASVDVLDTPVFDVRDGAITAWNGRGNAPRPIYSINGGDAQLVVNATKLLRDDLLRFGSQVAWIDDGVLSTCGIGTSCNAPYRVASVSGTVTASGDALYFVVFEGGAYRLEACPRLDLLAGSCTPTNPSSGFEWAGARDLRVSGDSIFAVTQFGSLIRARL